MMKLNWYDYTYNCFNIVVPIGTFISDKVLQLGTTVQAYHRAKTSFAKCVSHIKSVKLKIATFFYLLFMYIHQIILTSDKFPSPFKIKWLLSLNT